MIINLYFENLDQKNAFRLNDCRLKLLCSNSNNFIQKPVSNILEYLGIVLSSLELNLDFWLKLYVILQLF